jgi:hypothetical protein
MKLCHGDTLALLYRSSLLSWTILFILIGKVFMPAKLASGKEKDITECRIEGVKIRDAIKGPIMKVENDILGVLDLVTISWDNNCYLLY